MLKAPSGTTMLGGSALLTFSEYVKIWEETLGVKASLQPLTLEEISDMFPGGLGKEVGETIAFVGEYGWDGGEGAILPEKAGVKRSDLTDIVDYIKTTDWSSVLA